MSIEKLKDACEAATPGRWETNADGVHLAAITASMSPAYIAEAVGDSDAAFIALAHKMMPQLLEAVALLTAAREEFMRYECDGAMPALDFVDAMQGILAGDVCSETLEALGALG